MYWRSSVSQAGSSGTPGASPALWNSLLMRDNRLPEQIGHQAALQLGKEPQNIDRFGIEQPGHLVRRIAVRGYAMTADRTISAFPALAKLDGKRPLSERRASVPKSHLRHFVIGKCGPDARAE
jgi:hypothetical protein